MRIVSRFAAVLVGVAIAFSGLGLSPVSYRLPVPEAKAAGICLSGQCACFDEPYRTQCFAEEARANPPQGEMNIVCYGKQFRNSRGQDGGSVIEVVRAIYSIVIYNETKSFGFNNEFWPAWKAFVEAKGSEAGSYWGSSCMVLPEGKTRWDQEQRSYPYQRVVMPVYGVAGSPSELRQSSIGTTATPGSEAAEKRKKEAAERQAAQQAAEEARRRQQQEAAAAEQNRINALNREQIAIAAAQDLQLRKQRERYEADLAAQRVQVAQAEAAQRAYEAELARVNAAREKYQRDLAAHEALLKSMRSKQDREALVDWPEAVSVCELNPQNPQSKFGNWRCVGPLQFDYAKLGVGGSQVSGTALFNISNTCGGGTGSIRDLGPVNGFRVFGCSFGLHPTTVGGSDDAASKFGISYVPGRITYRCPSYQTFCRTK